MSAPEDGSARGETGENADLQVARGELVEVLLRESREELERIDLKASILLSVCSLALAALVHAVAYLHWDPRALVGFQWFLGAGMALGARALVALAAAVWPRLGHGGEGEITYFGHVTRFGGLEELIAGLDKEASRHATRSDHSAKRLLALSRIIYDKYRYIRWGMGLFGVCVLLCTVTA